MRRRVRAGQGDVGSDVGQEPERVGQRNRDVPGAVGPHPGRDPRGRPAGRVVRGRRRSAHRPADHLKPRPSPDQVRGGIQPRRHRVPERLLGKRQDRRVRRPPRFHERYCARGDHPRQAEQGGHGPRAGAASAGRVGRRRPRRLGLADMGGDARPGSLGKPDTERAGTPAPGRLLPVDDRGLRPPRQPEPECGRQRHRGHGSR